MQHVSLRYFLFIAVKPTGTLVAEQGDLPSMGLLACNGYPLVDAGSASQVTLLDEYPDGGLHVDLVIAPASVEDP